ncbi:hypothetical protein [Rhodococcus sp. 11-3]|uniref:hypothetical protein n=1 Tax=Rhodococcus sp. 11-3 TaxID=2854796 RepID=UPI00203BD351|nr:hypothetical protein [Rhodococcus sp. 11-3]USC17005.1 hypothetical protein KZJ41_09125 [Rhodococcus sp. 11-3]
MSKIVRNLEELAALPPGSIIMDDSGEAYRVNGILGAYRWMFGFGTENDIELTAVEYPAVVLYNPEDEE